MITTKGQVSVTDSRNEFICVDILPFKLQQQSFEFTITGADKITHRRGYFRAPSVQFRTKNLKAGSYQLQLFLNGVEWENTSFEINLSGNRSVLDYLDTEQ